MPRLRADTVQGLREKIEAAARASFIRRGYNATTTREIALAVGLSAGALYVHYPSKEALFAAVVKSYQRRLVGARAESPLRAALAGTDFPHDVPRLARAIRDLVFANRAYWLLWYIDVVEFEGKHFRAQVAPKALLGAPELKARFAVLRREGTLRIEPEVAFVMVYMHLFNYYCIEALFGGRDHYGVPERDAVSAITDVFLHGMITSPTEKRS